MAKGVQHQNWLFHNRLHVGQLRYQLRRFEKQCEEAGVDRAAIKRYHDMMIYMARLLSESKG